MAEMDSVLCSWLPTRIRSPRVADLRGGGEGLPLQEEDAGADRRAGGRPPQSEEQALGVGSPAVRHHRAL